MWVRRETSLNHYHFYLNWKSSKNRSRVRGARTWHCRQWTTLLLRIAVCKLDTLQRSQIGSKKSKQTIGKSENRPKPVLPRAFLFDPQPHIISLLHESWTSLRVLCVKAPFGQKIFEPCQTSRLKSSAKEDKSEDLPKSLAAWFCPLASAAEGAELRRVASLPATSCT